MKLKWRTLPGFYNLYRISDAGHVARIWTHGNLPKPILKLVKPHKKPNGYLAIDIQRSQRRYRSYVHRLVWEAFRGVIPNGLEINHKNGDRVDNRLANLELVTRSANMLHCFQSLSPSLKRRHGETHHKAKLTADDVKKILGLYGTISAPKIAKMFAVSKTAIHYIAKGRNWKHFTGRYQPYHSR
jgi:hypothetical protein